MEITMTEMFKTSLALACAATMLSGCAGEWAADSHAPADYKTSYTRITDKCDKSNSHGGKYVHTYISAGGLDAWKAGTAVPKGTVLIKEGYADSGCTEVIEHWTMKKIDDKGDIKDWNWQTLDEYGSINQQDQSAMGGCAGCHTSYKASDYIGTPAPATGT